MNTIFGISAILSLAFCLLGFTYLLYMGTKTVPPTQRQFKVMDRVMLPSVMLLVLGIIFSVAAVVTGK